MDLGKAIELAARAHAGQVDKCGEPYILHPLRVMLRLKDPTARIVAVLHDVVEDTPVTLARIKALGFKKDVLEALDLVTHRKGTSTYPEYIRRIRDSGNRVALQVKLADLADNSDPARLARLAPDVRRRMSRRHRAASAILARRHKVRRA